MTALRVVGSAAASDAHVRVTTLATLEEILAWCHAQRPMCDVVDVIVQDEYCHDVIVRAAPPAYLIFDTT